MKIIRNLKLKKENKELAQVIKLKEQRIAQIEKNWFFTSESEWSKDERIKVIKEQILSLKNTIKHNNYEMQGIEWD